MFESAIFALFGMYVYMYICIYLCIYIGGGSNIFSNFFVLKLFVTQSVTYIHTNILTYIHTFNASICE